jgi:hypothetical protein
MEFEFTIKFNYRDIRLRAVLIYSGRLVERYRVEAKNRSLVFQTNAPLLRKLNLRHKKWDWKLFSGNLDNAYLLETIPKALEAAIKEHDKSAGQNSSKTHKR